MPTNPCLATPQAEPKRDKGCTHIQKREPKRTSRVSPHDSTSQFFQVPKHTARSELVPKSLSKITQKPVREIEEPRACNQAEES